MTCVTKSIILTVMYPYNCSNPNSYACFGNALLLRSGTMQLFLPNVCKVCVKRNCTVYV